jgi:hypothetical protein
MGGPDCPINSAEKLSTNEPQKDARFTKSSDPQYAWQRGSSHGLFADLVGSPSPILTRTSTRELNQDMASCFINRCHERQFQRVD